MINLTYSFKFSRNCRVKVWSLINLSSIWKTLGAFHEDVVWYVLSYISRRSCMSFMTIQNLNLWQSQKTSIYRMNHLDNNVNSQNAVTLHVVCDGVKDRASGLHFVEAGFLLSVALNSHGQCIHLYDHLNDQGCYTCPWFFFCRRRAYRAYNVCPQEFLLQIK